MNEDSRMTTFGSVVQTSAVARKIWIKRVVVSRAVILAAAFGAITIGVARLASAHKDPPTCSFNGPSSAISASTKLAMHGDKICYIIGIADNCPGCCNVTGLNTHLILPNGIVVPITTNAAVNQGESFDCPSADPRCVTTSTCSIPATIGYEYVVNHADEMGQTGVGCPIVPVSGTGTVWASISGTGVDHISTNNGTASICQSIPVDIPHACCEPCSGTCTDVVFASDCPLGSTFTPNKDCDEVVCNPLVCPGPIPPCEAGQACSPATGQCVNLPDAPLSTPCEADGNLCTIDHCNGQGSCVQLNTVQCPGPIPPCDAGQVCNPATGQCVNLPDAPLSTPCVGCPGGDTQCNNCHCDGIGTCVDNPDPFSTPCEADGNPCTIDHCDGQGLCVLLRSECDDPNFCNDNNACTEDICDINQPGCCSNRLISCPTRPCFRLTGCDPILGCQYSPDCRTGELAACCPDDGNACTHEFCDPNAGLCGSTSDCTTGFDCEEVPPAICTVDSCVNNCCEHHPLCPAGVTCCADGALCDDGNACTTDTCGTDGCCVHTPLCSSDADCNDSNACTDDSCGSNGCCIRTPHECPPRNCFTVICDSVLGCVYTPDCRAGKGCCADDGNPCTHEFCDQASGFCGSTPDCTVPADCDDGVNCTVESCENSCCGHRPLCLNNTAGVPSLLTQQLICCADGASCDDRNACTDDSCVGGCCSYTPHVCPPCTSCDSVLGCIPDCRTGTDCCADDGNPCTHEFCAQATGLCSSTSDCTTAGDCNDNNACTTDTCVAGCCVNTPLCRSAADCPDDANACTAKTCVAGCCGQEPIVPCCGDGIRQGTEQCDGSDFPVTAPPTHGACRTDCTFCGDGIRNGGEECDDGNDVNNDLCTNACTAPGTPCDDGNPCTEDHCVCANHDNDDDDGSVATGKGGDGDDDDNDTGGQPCVCPPQACHDDDDSTATAGGDDSDDDDGGNVQACVCVHIPICTGACCPNCDDGDPCTVDTCVPGSGNHDDNGGSVTTGIHADGDDDGGSGSMCVCKHTNTCRCGDNVINRPEETCDGTAFPPGTPPDRTCRENCTFCGDGIRQAGSGEECDGHDTGAIAKDSHDCSRGCDSNCKCIPSRVETCRSPGFWSTHACGASGVPVRKMCEGKKDARNVTQMVITECGGCLNVCGDIITNTVLNDSDSSLEAMCINEGGVRQLARHLTSAALNCCVSGGGNSCQGISIQALFAECNAACAAGSTTGAVTGVDCIEALDCFNNGGHYTAGSCAFTEDNCHNRNLGICSGGSICTEAHRCPLGETCGAPGSAGSSNACNSAKGNACYVIGASTCGTGGPNGPQSCP